MALAGAKNTFPLVFRQIELSRGFHVIAGPCSVGSAEQIHTAAAHLADHGVRILRGGGVQTANIAAFVPRPGRTQKTRLRDSQQGMSLQDAARMVADLEPWIALRQHLENDSFRAVGNGVPS